LYFFSLLFFYLLNTNFITTIFSIFVFLFNEIITLSINLSISSIFVFFFSCYFFYILLNTNFITTFFSIFVFLFNEIITLSINLRIFVFFFLLFFFKTPVVKRESSRSHKVCVSMCLRHFLISGINRTNISLKNVKFIFESSLKNVM